MAEMRILGSRISQGYLILVGHLRRQQADHLMPQSG